LRRKISDKRQAANEKQTQNEFLGDLAGLAFIFIRVNSPRTLQSARPLLAWKYKSAHHPLHRLTFRPAA
jgi:hypothetical protein